MHNYAVVHVLHIYVIMKIGKYGMFTNGTTIKKSKRRGCKQLMSPRGLQQRSNPNRKITTCKTI